MFKRSVLTGVFALALMAIGADAQAATTGKVELKGTVAAVCEISVTSLNASLNLVGGERGRKVASIEEHCNDHDGYTVSFNSSNRGTMNNKDGDKVDYTISYDRTNNKALNQSFKVRRNAAKFRQKYDLAVNLDASATRVAGDYSDTITVTIKAN